ncbi:hypothetical protein HFO27_32810 [Rhizobium leguminosarum]|uniref:hypothetical protein n=1 Tax=Rhizobium leguminosarum TaxID=384 RepID=UPI001C8FDAC1|nr:hypothetical protein [Rhizobium leguminosarum]MBY3179325.1 hypothetical protein [Rhizobium leguminosarum]
MSEDSLQALLQLREMFVERRRGSVLKYLQKPTGTMTDLPKIQEQIQWIDSAVADERKELGLAAHGAFSQVTSFDTDVSFPQLPGRVVGHPDWPAKPPSGGIGSNDTPGNLPQQINVGGNKDWPGKIGG